MKSQMSEAVKTVLYLVIVVNIAVIFTIFFKDYILEVFSAFEREVSRLG